MREDAKRLRQLIGRYEEALAYMKKEGKTLLCNSYSTAIGVSVLGILHEMNCIIEGTEEEEDS